MPKRLRHFELGQPLSPREHQVLSLMCAGLKLTQIEGKLGIARGTVAMYRTRITRKSGCTTAAQLGIWAVRNGVVKLEENTAT